MSSGGDRLPESPASLESLIEAEDLGLEFLHPGGPAMTRELATLAGVAAGSTVLDVAAGTGETARLLAMDSGVRVTTVDISPSMIARQRRKLFPYRPALEIVQADAHQLPFPDNSFDVVLSECSVCHFDRLRSIREMARVVRPGGRVGIHDLSWKENAPEPLKRRLLEIEGEEPQTVDGWIREFEAAGLRQVQALDRSDRMAGWMRDERRALGPSRYATLLVRILKRWGISGLLRILESERIFSSEYLGYAIVLGVKR